MVSIDKIRDIFFEIIEHCLDIFFETLEHCLESMALPTGDTLGPTCAYAAIITVVSGITEYFELGSCIRWQGALIATILLFILFCIGGRGKNEISRLYRAAESSATAVKKRAKSASADIKARRSSKVNS